MQALQNIMEWDKELFLSLNSVHNDFWDTIMLLSTKQEIWLPLFGVILFFFAKNYRGKAWLVLLSVALLIFAADQLSVLMKDSFQRFRPTHEPAIANLVHEVLGKGGLYGFVSSHAANSVALLVFTSRLFKNKSFYLLLFIWTAVFCYSRIYLGVHYPLDIMGGVILGWIIGVAVYKVMLLVDNYFLPSRSPRIEKTALLHSQVGIMWLVFVVLIATVFAATHLLHKYNFL